MMTLEQIRQALQDRKLTVIADATGLHYNTVIAIKRGEQINPSYETLQKLAAYFEGQSNG
jgi:transcriptional regulator with XRE-family HTH domain